MKQLIYSFSLLLLFSCGKKSDPTLVKPPTVFPAVQIANLNIGGSLTGGPAEGSTAYYFSLSEEKLVAVDANWDLSFSGIFNTDIHSNTKAGVYLNILNTSYNDITVAPSITYNMYHIGSAGRQANGWYSYDSETHIVSVVPAKTIFIKKNNQLYKMEMISIYKGAPQFPTMEDEAPYLSFRYQRMQ
ncbi:HmuY family protein [Sphingobacteriaceae bacterium WQ 2009]|uniref:HmuY family protein n=1 Tax=Rhinopithecimicrobium faecis TaxID=2820698 RepID=A0A8T4HBH1_9SPHI|nr:HmuY family protein [Sphingobacteriaceae bacterium WQ 2009]